MMSGIERCAHLLLGQPVESFLTAVLPPPVSERMAIEPIQPTAFVALRQIVVQFLAPFDHLRLKLLEVREPMALGLQNEEARVNKRESQHVAGTPLPESRPHPLVAINFHPWLTQPTMRHKFATEILVPLIWIVASVPFIDPNRTQELLTGKRAAAEAQLPSRRNKISSPMVRDDVDLIQNCGQHSGVGSKPRLGRKDKCSPPALLDWLGERLYGWVTQALLQGLPFTVPGEELFIADGLFV